MQSTSQGNVQVLPNGHVLIGWGPTVPALSEFQPDGTLIFDAWFPPQGDSYRAYRFPWTGHPADRPAVAAQAKADNSMTVYASWNGATEVARWQVLAGPTPNQLKPAAAAARTGFETAIPVPTTAPYVAVQASDAHGQVLGTSPAVRSGA